MATRQNRKGETRIGLTFFTHRAGRLCRNCMRGKVPWSMKVCPVCRKNPDKVPTAASLEVTN